MSKSSRKKLRIGLLLDSYNVPHWVHLMLKEIINSESTEICLTILNKHSSEKRAERGNFFQRMYQNRKNLLYFSYRSFEKKRFVPDVDLSKLNNCKELLHNVPEIRVAPKQTKFSDVFQQNDIKKIESHNVDVLIRLGFRILHGRILKAAKYGIWSYHDADNTVNRGGPAAFWEVVNEKQETGSVLQILNEDLDGGLVLARTFTSTDPLYTHRSRNNQQWNNVVLIPRKLKELYDMGETDFFSRIEKENSDLEFYDEKLFKQPTNNEMINIFAKHFKKYLRIKLQDQRYSDQWFLLFDLRDDLSKSLWRFQKIIPPTDRFYADPFPIFKNNKYYIFIEEFLYNSNKGHISVITMDKNGKYSTPKKIIEKPYQLSYPFIFQYKRNYFMIPETLQNKTIELYKCKKFPFEWNYFKTVKNDIVSCDNTILNYNGKWWLFASQPFMGAGHSDELSLFYSSNPIGDEWIPHPKNPIISDVRKARCAGKIFEYNGQLYRPSQDCSRYYGRGVIFNKIKTLNELEYDEVIVDRVYPNWDKDMIGLHTFAYEKNLTMFDGKFKLRRS